MATKFGYVKRDATSQVNWAAVATQFTDILSAEAQVREDQKAEIDKASREMVETLQNAPTGDYVDGNQFVNSRQTIKARTFKSKGVCYSKS